MQITPYVGSSPVRPDSFSVLVDPRDEERLNTLASQASEITSIGKDTSFAEAVEWVKKLKTVLAEVEDAKRMAMRPFAAVEEAIRAKAREVTAMVLNQQQRLKAMCDAYVEEEEAKARQLAKERETARRTEEARLQAKVVKAREAQRIAEEKALENMDNAKVLPQLLDEAAKAKTKAQLADLEKSLAADIAEMDQATTKTKVPEGGVRHTYDFTLVDIKEVLQLTPQQVRFLKVLRWELDKLACNDVVKSQLLVNPDAEPRIPGIEIKRKTSIYTRGNV